MSVETEVYKGPKCADCYWWVKLSRLDPLSGGKEAGQCHRRPPQVVIFPQGQMTTLFPITQALAGCGEQNPRQVRAHA